MKIEHKIYPTYTIYFNPMGDYSSLRFNSDEHQRNYESVYTVMKKIRDKELPVPSQFNGFEGGVFCDQSTYAIRLFDANCVRKSWEVHDRIDRLCRQGGVNIFNNFDQIVQEAFDYLRKEINTVVRQSRGAQKLGLESHVFLSQATSSQGASYMRAY